MRAGTESEDEESFRWVVVALDAVSTGENRSVAELAAELGMPVEAAGAIVEALESWVVRLAAPRPA